VHHDVEFGAQAFGTRMGGAQV